MRSIRRQLLSAVLGSFVLAAAMLGVAGPASAHDAAESSSPAQGATVATPPEAVSVTFNKNPVGIGAQFSVKDPTGSEWADGAVEIVDNVASQKLKAGAPAGAYTVSWRVVSSDSHPIEGTFGFTAASAAPGAAPAAGATPSGGPPSDAAVPGMGTAQPGSTASPAPVQDASQPFPWSLVVFAAVAVGLLVAIGFLAKRRLGAGSDDEDGAA
ncbi:MAG: copper resistance protein CopC [Pseudarthrobacter sp.]|nr:copper resistance protein CopC [Pseudarthrobacter sp.]